MARAAQEAPASGRRYGGRDAAQRREERRIRLLAAGLELFGTAGYPATSVKAVCREAQLTERYFYESYGEREDLLAAVYDELVREVRAATVAAVEGAGAELADRARAGLDTFVRALTDDPRTARVILVEVVGVSARLEERRLAVIHEFADFMTAIVSGHRGVPHSARLSMTSVALVGAVNQLLVDWALGRRPGGVEEIVDLCTALFLAAYDVVAPPGPA